MNDIYIKNLTRSYGESGGNKKFLEELYKQNVSKEDHEKLKRNEKVNLSLQKIHNIYFSDLKEIEFYNLCKQYRNFLNKKYEDFEDMLINLKWEESANEINKIRKENR